MPWSYPNNVPSVAKNKSAKEQRVCVRAANDALKRGKSDGEAIRACIGAMKNVKKGKSSMSEELAATRKEKNAQKARSRRYGISIRDDGNIIKPSKWSHVADSQWGDPVNYLYPVPDKAHAANAKSRFQQNKSSYDSKSRAVVRRRLNRLLRKHSLKPMGNDDGEENTFSENYLLGEIILQDDKETEEDDPHKGMFRIPAAREAHLTRRIWIWEQEFFLDEDLFDSFIDNWKSDVIGRDLAIDNNHRAHDVALAWIKDVQVEDGNLVLYAQPTDEGEGVLGESLRYASIWFTDNYTDQETQIEFGPTLLGCAATNVPFVHRQEPMSVVMSDDPTMSPSHINYFVFPPPDSSYGTAFTTANAEFTPLDNSETEESTQEETGGNDMPEENVQDQPNVLRVGDQEFTPQDIEALIGELQQSDSKTAKLQKQLQESKVNELCDKASARGVAPVVIEAARQILTHCEMSAEKTITIELPLGESEDPAVASKPTRKLNYFGAIAHLLNLVPGRMGELTYTDTGEQPSRERKTGNRYVDGEAETVEEAEEAARKRRKELGIETSDAPEM